jgi:hypothetical protein
MHWSKEEECNAVDTVFVPSSYTKGIINLMFYIVSAIYE